MRFKTAMMAAAIAAVLAAPMAAQAGTVASKASGKIASDSAFGARKATFVKRKNGQAPVSILATLLPITTVVATVAVVAATSSDS